MKQVIRIGKEPKEEKVLKPIEFTHWLSDDGWKTASVSADNYNMIVYLGLDHANGHLFAAYEPNHIVIYMGELNDGVY